MASLFQTSKGHRAMTMIGLFDRLRETRASRVRKLAVTAVAVLSGSFQICGFVGLRFNSSPSLPVGVYVTTTDHRANLVEFCPEEPFAALAIKRGYRDPGSCRDGAAPLLKPVVASANDSVELSARGISVNGVLLPNTAPLSKDTKGRPLEAWRFGRYIVAPEAVWVASSYHPRSFDSRYFGPLATAAILYRLKPLLTL
jgi:conjugative transfer signal peptidase TraF